MKFYQLYYCFAVHECESIEVTEGESWALGLYERTDDRASAPTKKSIWKLSNKSYYIYYARSAKAWRLGHRTDLTTEDYYYSGKY